MSRLSFNPPRGPMHATVKVPGSKSVANRALICAMLAEGKSTIRGIPDGDDTQVILDVLTAMSAVSAEGDAFVVRGASRPTLPGIIDAGLAGTSSRFLTAVAAIATSVSVIDGGEPLRGRPMADLHEALQSLGAQIEPLGTVGHLPVSVSGSISVGGEIRIRSDVSSQFISALMLIAPTLSGGLSILLDGTAVSQSYIEMTARVMAAFGVEVQCEPNSIVVPEGSYVPCEYVIEPDFSSAAFPIVAVLLRGGEITVPYLGTAMTQGDAAILDIVRQLGATVAHHGNDVVVSASAGKVTDEIALTMSDCSDLVPVVAVALAQCAKNARIDGVGFIRHKESDRLGDVASEMSKVGASVQVTDDGLRIEGAQAFSGAVLSTHHDHRLAMSFALLSLLTDGIVIDDPSVVSKSWPHYFDDMVDILGPVRVAN